MSDEQSPFLTASAAQIIYADSVTLGLWDKYPVSPGHALVVPRRQVASWFDATREEQVALIGGIDRVRSAIVDRHGAAAFNIGVNVGAAAGQTVSHLHVHVIPRYPDDVPDPRGGVHHVIPSKANYLSAALSLVSEPGDVRLVCGREDHLLKYLQAEFERAVRVDIAVAFIMRSGVEALFRYCRDLIDRCGGPETESPIRIVTGDYLDATDPDALRRLLDLGRGLELYVYETRGGSFHPKSYIFHRTGAGGVAFVGSSNLSQLALTEGVEWNFRTVSSVDSDGLAVIAKAFDALLASPQVRPVDHEWINQYEKRRVVLDRAKRQERPSDEPPPVVPEPHQVQVEALKALEATRQAGNRAGLVVLATGLGKTWLSAFDSATFDRVLFVAHREEILNQAQDTFRRIRPHAALGFYTGTLKDRSVDVLFASIQTLSRARNLRDFDPREFDYIVIDEFHHAHAATYRRVLEHFVPRFKLGLTATPERTDGGDVLALCDENLVFRCDLMEGIRIGLLSPFQYFGVPDGVEYENIPWRSGRFEPEALTNAFAVEARAENAFEQLQEKGGDRTLCFCCSVRHANYMAAFLNGRGLRAAAVHSDASTSAPRSSTLEFLERGELDVVCAVDMFNEGVDLPHVDTVVMLRPTESSILWLQQIGRGLRKVSDGSKPHLRIIDYIGNHRSFLVKPATLLGANSDQELIAALKLIESQEFELPPGCEIQYELEAMSILRQLASMRLGRTDRLLAWYESFKERTGSRPTASEAFHEGFSLRTVRTSYQSWLKFVDTQGDFSPEESELLRGMTGEFLAEVERTPMTKSYKMVVLKALCHREWPESVTSEDLVTTFRDEADRSSVLSDELGEELSSDESLRSSIERNPVNAWVGRAASAGVPFFEYRDSELTSKVPLAPAQRGVYAQLVSEVTDWRLAEHRQRVRMRTGVGRTFPCKVIRNSSGNPIIVLPDRASHQELPHGETPLRIGTESFVATFAKIAINVVRDEAGGPNRLPELLNNWFDSAAGEAGLRHGVLLHRHEDGWELSPRRRTHHGLNLHADYFTKEIKELFSGGKRKGNWMTGYVRLDTDAVMLVTLKKRDVPEHLDYEDKFLDGEHFQWESPAGTTQASEAGAEIVRHVAMGREMHLFVRETRKHRGQTVPYTYCGTLRLESFESEKPIRCWFLLDEPLPDRLARRFVG